jgi:predicted PurR-regulated permease PerM
MSISAVGGFIIAALQTILLVIIGVDFALLWGLFAFFMSFVPQVGILLALIPPAIMALVQFGVTEMLIVIGGYLIIYQVVENFLKRPYLQKKLNVSMLVIFISLILWGWVLGPIGAVLSVPMALLVKAILDSGEETRWMAYLMSDRQEPYNSEVEDELEN